MRLRTAPYLARATLARARALRRDMTDAERSLWRGLREQLPWARFRHPVPLGPFHADFASHRFRLIVEVDGGQHGTKLDHDAARTRCLNREGYRVLRFWNNEVLGNLDGVLQAIAAETAKSSPPLWGRVREGGARPGRARAQGAHPHPNPPHKGEGADRAPRDARPNPPHKGEVSERRHGR